MDKRKIDSKYVKQLQKGNMEAFDKIYEFYQNSLYYFSMTIVRNRADAEEIVQETFIQVINNIHSLKKVSAFNSWIHRIAYNQAMLVYQKRSKILQFDEDIDFENIIEADGGPVDMFENKEVISAVKKEIEKMPDKFIQIAQLRYFENLTTKEIAYVMNVAEGTVKTRLSRVRQLIQPALEAQGYTPKKYFSFTVSPFVLSAFYAIIQNNQMSNETVSRIHDSVIDVSGNALKVIGASSTIATTSIATTGTKVIMAAAIGGSGLYGAYRTLDTETQMVDRIVYYEGLTNKDIEVKVYLREPVEANKISITKKENSIKFKQIDDTLVFYASSNGDYILNVNDEVEKISIYNIDKKHPVLTGVEYENEILKFNVKDDFSEIDYKKSYVKQGEQIFKLSNENSIEGFFKGELKAYFYDIAGNMAEYIIEI